MPVIIIPNDDAMGATKPVGVQAEKVLYKGLRWLNYATSANDIVVVAWPLSKEYIEYRQAIIGFCPEIVVLENISLDTGLDIGKTLKTNQLLKNFNPENYHIEAVVQTEDIIEFANSINALVSSTPKLNNFNNKINFKALFQALHFPVPRGKVAFMKEAAIRYAQALSSDVMLRKPNEADSQGNLALQNMSSIQLQEKISALDDSWFTQPLIVEELLNLLDSPCTLAYIDNHGKVQVKLSGVQLFTPQAYCWMSPPLHDRILTEKMENMCQVYGETISKQGARGWYDIDWGRDRTNTLVGIESNYRKTGWTAASILIGQLREKYHVQYVTLSCDVLPMRKQYTLDTLLQKLNEEKIAFTPDSPTGVIISSEPRQNYVGILIVAHSHAELQSILNHIEWLSQDLNAIKFEKMV